MVGVVGAEIPPITVGINAIVEQLKRWSKFNEDYAFHYVVVLWLLVSVVWGFIKSDPTHSIVMLFGGIGNSHLTHEGLKGTGTGIIKPIPEEKRYVHIGTHTDARALRPIVLALLIVASIVIVATIAVTWLAVTHIQETVR